MSEILKPKSLCYLFKFTFNALCLTLLLYQLIDITNNYLEFSHEVKLEINDDYFGIDLPSITFCMKRGDIWSKKNILYKIKLFQLLIKS